MITTVAGIGDTDISGAADASFGDGGLATDARLDLPIEVAVDESGSVYILEAAHYEDSPGRIRKVDAAGRITTVVGPPTESGAPTAAGEAGELLLTGPFGMTFDREGNIYVADSHANRVVRVDSAGGVTIVAGTGREGFSGDGGAAIEARLAFPADVAIDRAGNLYISDNINSRIRKVDPSGEISTFAGTGEPKFSGDGGRAGAASLSDPRAIAVDAQGNVYVADAGNSRIRMIDRSGTIVTVAGGAQGSRLGGGGPATKATLKAPTGLWVNGDGSFYIGDEGGQRVRFVDTSGVISTIAGRGGAAGFSGDGGPATEAELDTPSGVTTGSDGSIYIADFENSRVRRVCP